MNCKWLRSNGSPGRKFISLGRGEYSRKVFTGRFRPAVQPLTFCIPFNYDRKSTPITYLVWNFAYIFNCCSNPMSFKLWKNHKTRTFFYFFKAIKCICSPFGPFLQTEMIDFPTFPYTSASKSPPFHIPEGQIRYSFWAEPPRIGHCGGYPPPPVPGYVSRIFPPLNLNKSLNIHKETVSYRTLIVPIKVVNFQVIVPRKYHLNEY